MIKDQVFPPGMRNKARMSISTFSVIVSILASEVRQEKIKLYRWLKRQEEPSLVDYMKAL